MKRRTKQTLVSCCLALGLTFSGVQPGEPVKAAVEDSIPPTINGLSGNIMNGRAYGLIASSEAGDFYYLVLPQDTKIDITIDYIRDSVAKKNGIVGTGKVDGISPTQFEITGLQPRTSYVIYAFMTDLAGNDSEKAVVSTDFYSSTMTLGGTVNVTGQVAVDSTIKAVPELSSADQGVVSYQWYRIALNEDQSKVNAVMDETGGAAEDVLVPYIDEDILALDGTVVESGRRKAGALEKRKASYDTVTLANATPITGAVSSGYKIRTEDIGCRLVVRVTASNYIGELIGYTSTFVPKMMPEFTLPILDSLTYSASRSLSSISLPSGWKWVDGTIVPVAESNGYRAQYTPTDSNYHPVVMRIDVPIERKSLTASMVDVFDKTYTGGRITDNFEVIDGGRVLKRGQDYIVTYKNNKDVGTGTVRFEGIGSFKSSVSENYKINRCPVGNLTFTYDERVQYTGKSKTANLVVENGTKLLKKNRDYTVTYKNNRNIGTASAVIRGLGNYQGKKTIKFTIVPKTANITVKNQRGSYVSLKFDSVKGISGYALYFAKNKSFTKGKQSFYTTTGNTMTLRGMDRGSYYYLRLRTFKWVNGKKIFSKYGKIKTIWVY